MIRLLKILVILAIGAGAVFMAFKHAPPPSEADGFEIYDVLMARKNESGRDFLVIRGKIKNIWDERRQIPAVHAVLSDVNRVQLQSVDVVFDAFDLEAGAVTTFIGKLENPSNDAKRIEVTFK